MELCDPNTCVLIQSYKAQYTTVSRTKISQRLLLHSGSKPTPGPSCLKIGAELSRTGPSCRKPSSPSTLAASKSNVPKCNNWYYRSLINILYSDPEGGGNVTWSMRCNFDQTKSHIMRSTYVCGARTRHFKQK